MPKSKAPPLAYPVLQMDRLEQWCDLDKTRSYTVRRSNSTETRWYTVDMFHDGQLVGTASGRTLELASGNAIQKATKG